MSSYDNHNEQCLKEISANSTTFANPGCGGASRNGTIRAYDFIQILNRSCYVKVKGRSFFKSRIFRVWRPFAEILVMEPTEIKSPRRKTPRLSDEVPKPPSPSFRRFASELSGASSSSKISGPSEFEKKLESLESKTKVFLATNDEAAVAVASTSAGLRDREHQTYAPNPTKVSPSHVVSGASTSTSKLNSSSSIHTPATSAVSRQNVSHSTPMPSENQKSSSSHSNPAQPPGLFNHSASGQWLGSVNKRPPEQAAPSGIFAAMRQQRALEHSNWMKNTSAQIDLHDRQHKQEKQAKEATTRNEFNKMLQEADWSNYRPVVLARQPSLTPSDWERIRAYDRRSAAEQAEKKRVKEDTAKVVDLAHEHLKKVKKWGQQEVRESKAEKKKLDQGDPSHGDVIVKGVKVNTKEFEPGSTLSEKTVQAYLRLISDRDVAARQCATKLVMEDFVCVKPVVSVNTVKDNSSKPEQKVLDWMVLHDSLSPLDEPYEEYMTLLSDNSRWHPVVISRKDRTLTVVTRNKTEISENLKEGLQVLAASVKRKLDQVTNWKIETRPFSAAFTQDHQQGLASLIETEMFASGSMPAGVRSLEDFRQKMKFDLLAEAGKMEMEPVVDNSDVGVKYWDEVCRATNEDEILDATRCFASVYGKLICLACDKDGMMKEKAKKAISQRGNNREGWYQTKSKIKDHLLLDSHAIAAKKAGIPVAELPTLTEEEEMIRNSQSLHKLVESFPSLKIKSEDEIVCESCYSGARKGKFAVPPGAMESQEKQGDAFSKLKKVLKKHLLSTEHQERDLIQGIADCEKGMVEARNVYSRIKEKIGYSAYERAMAEDAAKGVPIGDINHSRAFARSLVPCFANVLREKFKKQMYGKFFTVIADKYTSGGTTYQIVGLVTQHNGSMQSYILDVAPVTSHDGLGLATALLNSLREYFTDDCIRKMCTGGAFDGQYYKLKVPKHLLDLLGVDEAARDMYTFNWDTAHILELAGKDARGQKKAMSSIKHPWLRSTLTICSKVSRTFAWGKKWHELQAIAEEVDDYATPKRFKSYSTTRFAAYQYDFKKAIYDNFAVICERAERTKDGTAKEIRSVPFALRLSGLMDVYHRIQVASKQFQKVSQLPWHVKQVKESLCSDLHAMKSHLKNDLSEFSQHSLLPTIKSALDELQHENSFRGVKFACFKNKNGKRLVQTNFKKESQNLIKHIDDFVSSFEKRFSENYRPIFDKFEEAFSVEAIMKREDDNVDLGPLVTGYKAKGLRLECSAGQLQDQYVKFCAELRGHFQNASHTVDSEVKFYSEIKGSSEFPEVLKMYNASASRSYCESVTESMASQIGAIMHGRARLTASALKDESFIIHNGPNSGTECDKLLEEALNSRFGDGKRHFKRSSDSNLKTYEFSKCIDKRQKGNDKIFL